MPDTEKRSRASASKRRSPVTIESSSTPVKSKAGVLRGKSGIRFKKNLVTGQVRKWYVVRDTFLRTSAAQQISRIREGIEATNLVGVAEALGVSHETIYELVGLSTSTAKRKVAKAETLDAPTTERLARIGAIEKLAEDTFGSADLANEWLRVRNAGLGNVTPLSMLDTDIGCREISRILNSIAYGGAA